MEETKEKLMEGDAEILQSFELLFSDLLLLSSSSSSSAEMERLDSISRRVMEALGPSGPGLLSITGVPKASHLRQILLPLARDLALLNNEDRRRILKDNNLGSDVSLKNPDRSVSSFALQLKYVQDPGLDRTSSGSNHEAEYSPFAKKEHSDWDGLNDFQQYGFRKLKDTFKELGICMMELGVRLAQVCDKAIGGHELEQSILDSCTAKGRLIHYHSATDNLILKEIGRTKQCTKGPVKSCFSLPHVMPEQRVQTPVGSGNNNGEGQVLMEGSNSETCTKKISYCRTTVSNLWQQWHYDYGIFTVLTAPMFMAPCQSQTTKLEEGICISYAQECHPPDDHTHLQIFDSNKNKILVVKSPPESFIVQVGESADILSKGKLRSTLHSVCRPLGQDNLSRETFVVFLQPAWDKTFSFSGYPLAAALSAQENSKLCGEVPGDYSVGVMLDSDASSTHPSDQESDKLIQEILRMIPPLSSRLKDGMTFAKFSRETTKQYYGGNGMQSKRE